MTEVKDVKLCKKCTNSDGMVCIDCFFKMLGIGDIMAYKCLKCNKEFGTRETVRLHLKKVHNIKTNKGHFNKTKVPAQKYHSDLTAQHERVVEK